MHVTLSDGRTSLSGRGSVYAFSDLDTDSMPKKMTYPDGVDAIFYQKALSLLAEMLALNIVAKKRRFTISMKFARLLGDFDMLPEGFDLNSDDVTALERSDAPSTPSASDTYQ